jgi:hypothetical protein
VPHDHSERNYALRIALARCDAVDDEFVMSDDDSRPLVELDETVFVRQGRYRRYWFGWLDDWDHDSTSFDACQHATGQVLGLLGFPRRAFASHMPQVINKVMLAEVRDQLAPAALRHPLCEWAAYFNVAPVLHPERFWDPEPYVTLGWPENPAAWQPMVAPDGFFFENHFPEHYAAGEVFAGVDPDDVSLEASIDKVVRWRHYEIALLHGLRQPVVGAASPAGWLRTTFRRARAAVGADPVGRERADRAAAAATMRELRRPRR